MGKSSTATFANAQYVGEDSYGAEYICGSDDTETMVENIVFEYNATEGILKSITNYITENGSTTELSPYSYWVKPTFSKTQPENTKIVVPPAGMVADEWAIAYTNNMDAAASGALNIGFDGDDVYIQCLAADYNSSTSDLWVKATKNEAGKYVIPANQFMGSVSFWMSDIECYFTAVDAEGNMIDAVLDFDSEKHQFTTSQALVLNAMMNELYPYQTFTNVILTKFNEVAATPADPTFKSIDFGEWSHGINCNIPAVGSNGETLNPKKLFYTVWVEKEGQQAPYTFLADMYWNFDEDMSEVPYDINYSSWDGSHSIYFNDDAAVFDNWAKVGIQSIYYGAGVCNKSAISWIANPLFTTGISDISTGQSDAKTVYFNLSGQRLTSPRKGMNIINGRKVMVK